MKGDNLFVCHLHDFLGCHEWDSADLSYRYAGRDRHPTAETDDTGLESILRLLSCLSSVLTFVLTTAQQTDDKKHKSGMIGESRFHKEYCSRRKNASMLLEIPCKDGKLQVLKEGVLQVVATNRSIWEVPCARITKFTMHPGTMTSVNLLVHTTQGIYQARMVTKADVKKLQDLFVHLSAEMLCLSDSRSTSN